MWKYIVWDWNGTLLDDISASLSSVNDMLERRNMEKIGIDRYKECIEVPISGFYEKVFNLENEDYEKLLLEYNEGYVNHLNECGLTAGVKDALDRFRAAGCKQIIVSSSNKNQLLSSIERYGVSEYFDMVIGSENYFAGSKIEKAKEYLKDKEKGSILVIGDLVHDAELAEEIGAECVLLTSGHENPKRLSKSKSTIVETVGEIFEKLVEAQ